MSNTIQHTAIQYDTIQRLQSADHMGRCWLSDPPKQHKHKYMPYLPYSTPSEIDLELSLAVFAGSGGKYLFHRIEAQHKHKYGQFS